MPTSPTEAAQLSAMPLSTDQWRVVDEDKVEREGFGILGYVRQVGDLFVTWIPGLSSETARFDSLEAAMKSLSL